MKYIDAEKLIAEIERFSTTEYGGNTFGDDVANGALDYVLEEIIPSLQQEQPSLPDNLDKAAEEYSDLLPNGRKSKKYSAIDFKAGAKWLASRVQPEVDLEKEYKNWWNSISGKINVEHIMEWYIHETARHFYELGLNARKEG